MQELGNQKQNLYPLGRCTIKAKQDAKIRSLHDVCYAFGACKSE
jgi:hypothetical protein